MKRFTRVCGHRNLSLFTVGQLLLLFVMAFALCVSLEKTSAQRQVTAALGSPAVLVAGAPGNQTEPALAFNATTHAFLVAWRDAGVNPNSGNIAARLVAADGDLVGDELSITDLSSLQRAPAVSARAGTPDFLVAWIDLRNNVVSESDIYVQLIRSGEPLGPNKPINTAPGRVSGVTTSPCTGSDSYLVAWSEDEDGQVPWRFFVFGRQIDESGDPLGPIVPLTADFPSPGFQQIDPGLAVDGTGARVLVVFRDARDFSAGAGSNDDIYGQFVNCAGQVLGVSDLPISIQYSATPGGNKQNLPAVGYSPLSERFLVLWQDERNDPDAGGADSLDIYGQVLSTDGSPLCTTPASNFAVTTAVGNQQDVAIAFIPDLDAFLVVWSDYRAGEGEIYGRLVSNCGQLLGDEINLSNAAGNQMNPVVAYDPEMHQALIVWEDGYREDNSKDIYGIFYRVDVTSPDEDAIYFPIIVRPEPIPPVTFEEKAQAWLSAKAVTFVRVEDIPGYGRDGCGAQVARYKDEVVCYPAIPGKAIVSFDFCHYGSPDQREALGKFGRAFLYDQAVYAIALMMSERFDDARMVLDHLSSYQNMNVSIAGAADGSFGFGFNTVGCPTYAPENRDSFYDMNYIRNGANAWVGYAFTMYQRLTGEDRYQEVAERTANYLLTERVPEDEPAAGLITGGYGRYIASEDYRFVEEDVTWVSTEHNIDAFFFFRDLGAVTGNATFSLAADVIREAMLTWLWNEEQGRFDRGYAGDSPDDADALDAASWGSILLLAACEDDKALRSLQYAQSHYWNAADGVSGHKPYAGIVDGVNWEGMDLVWSEGSLGVVTAYLKMGDGASLHQAYDILRQMGKLQDPSGGLFYAWHAEPEMVPDFPEVPSVAGTGWYIIGVSALENANTFWGNMP